MTETDSKDLADRLEQQTDELEHRSQELGQRTEDAAQEWQAKRRDPSVPGAPPNDDDDDDDDDERDGEGWDDPDEDEEEEDARGRRLRRRVAARNCRAELLVAAGARQVAVVVDQHNAQQLAVLERLERELIRELDHRRIAI